jgi:hypothetical protein
MQFYKNVPIIHPICFEWMIDNDKDSTTHPVDEWGVQTGVYEDEEMAAMKEAERYLEQTYLSMAKGMKKTWGIHFCNPMIEACASRGDSTIRMIEFAYHLSNRNPVEYGLTEVGTGLKIMDADTIRELIDFVMLLDTAQDSKSAKVRNILTYDMDKLRDTNETTAEVYRQYTKAKALDTVRILRNQYAKVYGRIPNQGDIMLPMTVQIPGIAHNVWPAVRDAVYVHIPQYVMISEVKVYRSESDASKFEDAPLLWCKNPYPYKESDTDGNSRDIPH